MRLIVGLGNPGAEYAITRHNLGFMALDLFCSLKKKSFSHDKLYDHLRLAEACLIKPNTYMNLSGKALKRALELWNPTELLVVYDDLELEPAQLRIRNGGGDGGHNGIKSCAEVFPTDELKRIRIGIGRPESQSSSDYVLAEFNDEERKLFSVCLNDVAKLLDTYVFRGYDAMLDEYSKSKKSYSDAASAGIISPKEEKRD